MMKNLILLHRRTSTFAAAFLIACFGIFYFAIAFSQDQGSNTPTCSQSDIAARAGFDGYMYLAIIKHIDSGDLAGARDIANEAVTAKVVELEQMKKNNLSAKEQESAQQFIKRVKDYQSAPTNSR